MRWAGHAMLRAGATVHKGRRGRARASLGLNPATMAYSRWDLLWSMHMVKNYYQNLIVSQSILVSL